MSIYINHYISYHKHIAHINHYISFHIHIDEAE